MRASVSLPHTEEKAEKEKKGLEDNTIHYGGSSVEFNNKLFTSKYMSGLKKCLTIHMRPNSGKGRDTDHNTANTKVFVFQRIMVGCRIPG